MPDSVFFSYARDDQVWVHQFREISADRLRGELRIHDYMVVGNSVSFGDLYRGIREKVGACAAVFAFLSQRYVESKASKAELQMALRRLREENVILVPVMLDNEGKSYWSKLGRSRAYRSYISNYAYTDFSNSDLPVEIYPLGRGSFPVIRKIQSLVDEVRSSIKLSSRPRRREAESEADVTDADGPKTSRTQGNGIARGTPLVVLGDPSRSPPDKEIGENVESLSQSLTDAGIAHKRWPHGWRNPEAQPKARIKPPATFLRTVTRWDIEDEAEAPRTMRWIERCGRLNGKAEGQVILWNPGSERVKWERDDLELRQESAEALAEWLASWHTPQGSEPAPLLLIIDEPKYKALKDAPYSDVLRMIFELSRSKFRAKPMTAEDFRRFVDTSRDRKLIIVVLDNNVSMIEEDGFGPLDRYEEIIERWQDYIAEINARKNFPVQVVWVALMEKLAKLNELGTWDKTTRSPIHVLRVFKHDATDGVPPLVPDPSSAMRVAAAMKELVEAPLS